jgi:hypothetical protein
MVYFLRFGMRYGCAELMATTHFTNGNVEMCSIVVMAVFFVLGIAPVLASGNDAFDSDISSLEMRFFFHKFAGETDQERLDRLDRVVFGHVRQGSEHERITRLLLAVPNVQSAVVQQATSTPQTANSLEPERPVMATAPPVSQPSNGQPSSEPYPTVSALEEQILGKTEANLPVAQRLSNLEVKAFGEPSTSTDLGGRVDLLKQYVAKQNGGSESYLTSSNAVGWVPGNEGLEGQVASMEKALFGVTYAQDRLSSRLDRLEKVILPNQPSQTFTPLVTRVENLESALNPTSAPQPMVALGQNYEAPNTVKKKRSIFHKLGVIAADVGEVAARSALYSGYGYGYGYGTPAPMMMGPPLGYW